MFSPVKSGRAWPASAEVYFCRAVRLVRSFAVRPPELYGGSVMTESTQLSGRVDRTLRASPWCREKGKEVPQYRFGKGEGELRLAATKPPTRMWTQVCHRAIGRLCGRSSKTVGHDPRLTTVAAKTLEIEP